ncbi:MAG: hypothetical protein ABUK01_16255 [Leptospirales bacterium]
MSITQLKVHLHEAIEKAEDEDTLNIVQDILTESKNLKETIQISLDQIKELEHSYEQYKNGETIDIDKANRMIDQWLAK